MFSSLAFLNAARSFPRCFADSAERSLSIKTDEKRELVLFISFFLFSQAQSLSILETKHTKIGRGRGGRNALSLDSVRTPLLTALFEEAEVSGFPVRCIAWNLIFSRSALSSDSTSITFREHSTLLSPGFSGILQKRRFSRLEQSSSLMTRFFRVLISSFSLLYSLAAASH